MRTEKKFNFNRVFHIHMLTDEQIEGIKKELKYITSRSGGKGGQNVNKIESKVTIAFEIDRSLVLSTAEKQLILSKNAHLSRPEIIQMSSEKHRSQLENKQEIVKKLIHFINSAIKPVKKRKPSKPSKASKRKRLESKKRLGEKKLLRKKVEE